MPRISQLTRLCLLLLFFPDSCPFQLACDLQQGFIASKAATINQQGNSGGWHELGAWHAEGTRAEVKRIDETKAMATRVGR